MNTSMKTFLTLLVLCTFTVGTRAAIVLSDNFNYTNGVLTNASSGKWRHTSGGANEVNVNTGQVELTRSETEDVASSLAVSYSAGSGVTLYSKFSVTVLTPPAGANGNYFAHLDGASARARVFVVTNGAAVGKFRLGLANNTAAPASVIWPVDLNTNQAYTVATRLVIGIGTATLWVNPTSDSDISITAVDAASASSVNGFAWRQDTGMGTLTVDSLVVATSFGEALSGNESPSISAIADQQVAEGTSTAVLPFTIGDAESAAEALAVFARAANSNLVQSISLGGSGSNRTVSVFAPPGQNGTTIITVFVTDGTTTNSDSFVLTVIPALLLSDDFNYADGALIGNGSWAHHSGANTGQVQVVGGSITLSTALTEDVNVALPGGPFVTNSGVQLYASFRVNFSALPGSSGDYFAHFNATGARCCLFVNTANAGAGKLRLGIANAAAGPAQQLATDLATNVSQFVVLRYNPATGVSTIWANPAAESDPGTNATDAATASALSTFAFREDTGLGTFTVDELRVGLSFVAVTGATGPRLRIEPLPPGRVRLAWPAGTAGFVLQTNAQIGTSLWQSVGQAPVVTGGENVITNSLTPGNLFFRLRN